MTVSLESTQVFIGANNDNEQALNLSLLPREDGFYNFPTGEKSLVSFCAIEQSTDLVSRCILLIKHVLAKLSSQEQESISSSVVFLLLPTFEHHDDSEAFRDFVQSLHQVFPQLFCHQLSQCFPFGRASLPIALKSIKQQFSEKKASSIVLLAVDSLYHCMDDLRVNNMLSINEQAGSMVPSEGAIYTRVMPSQRGLSINFCQQEVVPEKQKKQGIENLFVQAADKFSMLVAESTNTAAKIASLYLPGNGDDSQLPWLEPYFKLADCINAETNIVQNTLFTGELGCVTGLYNFLHIYHSYQQQELKGITAQLEVSDVLYQGLALYSWTGKV